MNDGSDTDTSSAEDHRAKRIAGFVLLVLVLLAPLALYGARGALKSTSNDPRQWLPRSFDATDTYDWFESLFGTDEVAVVSWPGATLDDPRVERFAEAAVETDYFSRALTGPSLLQQLTEGGMSNLAARRRLQGLLIGPDGRTTGVVLYTSGQGREERSAAVAALERVAALEINVPASELRLAGPTVDAAAIDAESRRLLFQLAGFSALISFVVASMRMRSLRMAMIVLAVAGYSTAASLALVYFSGGEMNLLMTMLPPLIYVLSISSAVHLANYYRDAAVKASARESLRKAMHQGRTPCLLAAGTTAIGLVSLSMSKIDPIRMFGIYAATGVLASVALLFIMMPALLRFFPPSRQSMVPNGRFGFRFRNKSISFIARYHVPVLIACLVLMFATGAALPSLHSTVKLQDRFLESSDMIADYRWLEENIGPMVPLEVVVAFDQDDQRSVVERMRVLAEVQKTIQAMNQPVATMSALNLSPPLPSQSGGVRDLVERKVFNSDRTIERLTEAGFLAESEKRQLWRITIRAQAIGDLDYGVFAESIRRAVDPVIQQEDVEAFYTGVIPLIYKAQRQLLQDLVRSFLAAFGVIAVVLVVVLRSVSAALMAMVPNLFPAVVVFGGIEWIDIPVQIGSVMTASAALGIAVDDTVHFLTWFRRGLQSGLPGRRALYGAFRRCAGAMMHTTLICSAGLLVFAISSFVPILHFAWLMVSLLLAALVGDLVLLPSILAGPLGRLFDRRRLAVDQPMP